MSQISSLLKGQCFLLIRSILRVLWVFLSWHIFQKRILEWISSHIVRKKYIILVSSFFLFEETRNKVIITGSWIINKLIIVLHSYISIVKFGRRPSCFHHSHIMHELGLSSIRVSSQLIRILEKVAAFSKKPQVLFLQNPGLL